ncbi:hypothetical protein BV20DRAFT_627797 [Pilatotrama ljubarskyi]|nr:hypothetical protein BV20DRAFT_627797 [Pilatotrama ljubarskyi]
MDCFARPCRVGLSLLLYYCMYQQNCILPSRRAHSLSCVIANFASPNIIPIPDKCTRALMWAMSLPRQSAGPTNHQPLDMRTQNPGITLLVASCTLMRMTLAEARSRSDYWQWNEARLILIALQGWGSDRLDNSVWRISRSVENGPRGCASTDVLRKRWEDCTRMLPGRSANQSPRLARGSCRCR